MAGFGANRSQQASQSLAETGLRGTPYDNHSATQLYRTGMQLNNVVDQGLENVRQDPGQYFKFGQALLPGGRFGVGSNADAGVNEYGRNMFSQTSADMGSRGFVSPENQGGVIGSAIQRSLPQLIPQMMQFQQAQFQAPQSLFDAARLRADFWNQARGARQSSSGEGEGTGFNFGITSPGR